MNKLKIFVDGTRSKYINSVHRHPFSFRRFGDRSHTETTVRHPDGTEERTASGSEDFERAWAERGTTTPREAQDDFLRSQLKPH